VAAGELGRAAEDLPNLTVVGYQPAERVPEVLATADMHVVALRRGLAASSVPSKMYSILAAGRPLIASVDEGSEVARVVGEAGAGVAVPPEDAEAFIAAVERLAADAEERWSMGASGRAWAEQWASPRSVAEAHMQLVGELLSR
jgi:colanic acid biosynthesis glycosyl transferase WcaI